MRAHAIVPSALLMLVSGSALAVPAILDRVPADSAVVVAIPSIETLGKNLDNIAALAGAPATGSADMLLRQLGVKDGLSKSGPLAIILRDVPTPPQPKPGAKPDDVMPEPEEPDALILVPTTDYKALLKNFGKDASGGVDQINLGDDLGFIKPVDGGFAVLGQKKASVEAFTGKGGNTDAFKKLIGAAGDKFADRGDLSVIVNVAKLRPLIKDGASKAIEDMATNMAMMGNAAQKMDPAQTKWMVDLMADGTRAAVFSAKLDSLGVSLDAVMALEESSPLASLAKLPGAAGVLLGKLPNKPYLAVAVADTSNPACKQILSQMPKHTDPQQAAQQQSMIDALGTTTGNAALVGFVPGGFMGAGMLSNTVAYSRTTDPKKAIDTMLKGFDAMKQMGMGEPSYTPGVEEIAGVKVDSWDIDMSKADPNTAQPGVAQGMMMMFGPSGPGGYVLKRDGGVIMTYGKNAEMLSAAIKADKGEDSLAGNTLIAQVSEKLPPKRLGEIYVGPKAILDTVIPFVAMMAGTPVQVKIPDNLPPIALSVAPETNAGIGTIYIPNQVIKTTGDVVKDVQKKMQDAAAKAGNGQPGQGNPGRGNGGGRGEQPKF